MLKAIGQAHCHALEKGEAMMNSNTSSMRYEAKMKDAGYQKCTIWLHEDNVKRIDGLKESLGNRNAVISAALDALTKKIRR